MNLLPILCSDNFEQIVECSLDNLFAFRKDAFVDTSQALLTLLDCGLIHHYYIASINLAPLSWQQYNYQQKYFLTLYKNCTSLKTELTEKFTNSELSKKEAYRLLNLCTFASTNELNICNKILADFPELITIYALSIGYSCLPHEQASIHLQSIKLIDDFDAYWWNKLLITLMAPDSARRCKLPNFSTPQTTLKRRKNYYQLSYQLIIAFSYRDLVTFKKILVRIIMCAPGLNFLHSIICKVMRSDRTFYNKLGMDEIMAPNFLEIWAENLIDRTLQQNSLLLGDANLIRNISEFSKIIPDNIRILSKKAAARLLYSDNQFSQWRLVLNPLIDMLLDSSNMSKQRIDPFQYEFYYDSIAKNGVSADCTRLESHEFKNIHFVFLSGVNSYLNDQIATSLVDGFSANNISSLYIGKSDLISTLNQGIAYYSEKSFFETSGVSADYIDKISDFLKQNIAAFKKNNKDIPLILISQEVSSLDYIAQLPEMLNLYSVIDVNPPLQETLYCSLHLFPGYEQLGKLTPLLGDYTGYIKVRNRIKKYLLTQSPINLYAFNSDSPNGLFAKWLDDIIQSVVSNFSRYNKTVTYNPMQLPSKKFADDFIKLPSLVNFSVQGYQDFMDWAKESQEDIQSILEDIE